jgi:hypothetical protein
MKLFCCYTPAHEVLFREYFRPSVPAGFLLSDYRLEIAGAGDFLSAEFLDCIRKKVGLIVRSIEDNPDDWIVWSDVDIVFLDGIESSLDRVTKGPDVLFFQRESPRLPDVNTGFLVIRTCPQAREFFERIGRLLEEKPGLNEQMAANQLLQDGFSIPWSHLPNSFYARTHGWPAPRDAVLYHANYTKSADAVGQKIAQFRELAWIRRWGVLAWYWSCVRRIPSAAMRRISGRA